MLMAIPSWGEGDAWVPCWYTTPFPLSGCLDLGAMLDVPGAQEQDTQSKVIRSMASS